MAESFLVQEDEDEEVIDYIGNAYLLKNKIIHEKESFWGDKEYKEIYLDDIVSVGYYQQLNIPLFLMGVATVVASIYLIQYIPVYAITIPFMAGAGIVVYSIFTMKKGYRIETPNPVTKLKLSPNERSRDFINSVREQMRKLKEKEVFH